MAELRRYQSAMSDSARWDGFRLREGDIVISAPPKCGTTWTQTLCALLVFDGATLDRPLTELSPWLDMKHVDLATVVAALDRQEHRRVIKSHTPLDGLPIVDGVTYLCLGRDPRDVVLSFAHHMSNLNPDVLLAIHSRGDRPLPDFDDPVDVFRRWVSGPADDGPEPQTRNSLAELVHHVRTFWDRRHEPGVALFHYNDLLVDLPGQLRRLAGVLSIELNDERIMQLAEEATFDRMRQRADSLVPHVTLDFWRSNRQFFHRGSSGQWREVLEPEDVHRYEVRLADIAPPDLVSWLHEGWLGAVAG